MWGTSVPNGFTKSCIYPHVMRIRGKVWSEFSPTLVVVVLLVVLEWPPEKPSYNLEIALLRSHSRESLRSLNSDLLYGNCCKDDCCSINSKYTTTQQNPISSQIGSSSNFLQHHRSNGWEKKLHFLSQLLGLNPPQKKISFPKIDLKESQSLTWFFCHLGLSGSVLAF